MFVGDQQSSELVKQSLNVPCTPNVLHPEALVVLTTFPSHSIRMSSVSLSGEGTSTSTRTFVPIGGHLLEMINAPFTATSFVNPPSVCSVPSFQ
jgi:hypothetical protein